MAETPESSPQPTTLAGQPPRDDRPSRLTQVLAWVGIIAGIVFVVAVIFFSGFALGRTSSGHYGWHRGYYGGGPGRPTGSCSMMGPGGQTGPGGMMGPGGPTTSTTTPRP